MNSCVVIDRAEIESLRIHIYCIACVTIGYSEVKMSYWQEIDGLRLAAASSRRNQFLMEILETQLPGVHFNVADNETEVEVEVELSPTTLLPQTLNAGSPRLVDGARESHIVLGYQQIVREWGFVHAAMKILAQEN